MYNLSEMYENVRIRDVLFETIVTKYLYKLKLKRFSKKGCCKRCRYVKFKGTMTI